MGYNTGRKPWRSEPWRSYGEPESTNSYATKQKLFYLGIMVVFLFGVLSLQLARMQLVNGDKYKLRAETNRLREVPIPPARGLIYDRNGVPLVQNKASFAAAVVAADIPEARQTEITIALQELTGVPAGNIAKTIDDRRDSNDPFTPAVIKGHLPESTAFALRERLANLPGVRVMVQSERTYTSGALMANILGFVGSIDPEEYSRLQNAGYQMADKIGKTGVEYTYESILRGMPGRADIETDASGRELRVLGQLQAKPGDNVILSIDSDLQQHVEQFVRDGMGKSINAAAVVIDVRTGELLAMVSLPSYDNNIFTGEVDQAALERLLTDPGKPMVDHALAEVYPPGSTFKQVTGLAALQEGVANADTMITSNGFIQVQNEYNPSILYTFKDWAALGALNFYRGVAMSSDVYFYYLSGGFVQNGKTVFNGLGADRLASWSRRFGLGSETGIDLPGESAGNVPDPDWKQKTVGEPWTVGDTYNFGIGQGYLTTTPLQMATVVAAVANGGNLLIPHVVKEIKDSSGKVVGPNQSWVKRSLGIDQKNLQIMREGMRQAVNNTDGTARSSATKYAVIAGKTGTAEFGERRPDGSYMEHGWYTGFGPFNEPEIAVVVFLEQGNGALSAAPVAGKIFEYYFSRKLLAQGQNQ